MSAIVELAKALEEIAGQVRQLEEKAREALEEPRDEMQYRRRLAEKTALLARLPEIVERPLYRLPDETSEECLAALHEMAEDAMQAQRIGSPFYMSVLLYGAEQLPGEPNDLERLILWLRGLA